MNAIGKVLKTNEKTAVVVSQRSSACASCHNCEAHGTCHAELIFGNQNEEITIIAENSVNAKTGDTVVLESSTSKTLGVSFFIFVFPLILTSLLYLLINYFSIVSGTFLPVVLILSYFVFFALSAFAANDFVKRHTSIHIVKILEEC